MGKDNAKYWINSGKLTLIERVSMLVFGVLTFYLLVRIMDKTEYGTWMLFITIHALLDTARSGFFKNPLIRYLNKASDSEKVSLQSSSLMLNIAFSILSALLLLAFAQKIALEFEAPGLVPLMYINVGLSVVLSYFSHFEFIQAARFRFAGPMVGNIIRSSTFCIFVLYFYYFQQPLTLDILGWGYLAATFLATASMFWSAKDIFARKFQFQISWIKTLFHYGKYTLGTNISAVLMRNIDTWMIAYFMTPAAVAIYNVAMRVANLFEVPTMALASILFPQAVQKAEEEGSHALKELYEKSVGLLMVMMIPMVIFVIIFSNQIVALIAGEDYKESGYILNITMLYGLIIPFNKQMGILLDAIGKAKLNMLFVGRNALINLVLNAMLIPMYGIAGAAYATLSTMVIVMVINQFYLQKTFNISLQSVGKYMVHYGKEIPTRIKQKLT